MILNLSGYQNLKRLPRKFDKLKSLEKIDLTGCSKLKNVPLELGKLESLTVLHADDITMDHQLASTTQKMVKSRNSFLWSKLSKSLKPRKSISFSLASLSSSLQNLSLANCGLSDTSIPTDLRSLSSLLYLNLSGNPIHSLPNSIVDLKMLKDLWLDSCTNLQSLPELPKSLIDLKTVNCISLKRITNLPNLLDTLFLDVSGCEKLVEVQGLFTLEPIRKYSADMINNLALPNLEYIENTRVKLYNKLTQTRQNYVLQGLYEFGISSTYVPGIEVPSWYSTKSMESTISFILTSDSKVTTWGLNICIVDKRSSGKRFKFWSNQNCFTFYIKVDIKTKGVKWIYYPTFIGIPAENEDMTLLSHWKFGRQMETGDQVSVSVISWSKTFQMKEFGIHLTNEEEEMKHDMTHLLCENFIDDIPSTYQLRENAYFLSNAAYVMDRESSDSELLERTKAVLYDNLFGDSEVVIVFTDGSERKGEDSDYDYPDSSDEDVGEDDYDDGWLTSLL